MTRAREAILARGGAARCNVFTRITLALFGQVPWRAVPVMPVEIMLLPRWFPFHLDKVSYWSRTVIVPLLILMALRPRARNPRGVGIAELFATPPELERHYITSPPGARWGRLFLAIDRTLRAPRAPPAEAPPRPRARRRRRLHQRAPERRGRPRRDLPGDGERGDGVRHAGLSGRPSGPRDRPAGGPQASGRRAGHRLVPALPVAALGHGARRACDDGGGGRRRRAARPRALDWIAERQILDVVGDWARVRPQVRPGGWPFEYRNDHYPDVDDSAVIIAALHRADPERYRHAIARGTEWVLGLQSANGGWGSFDADNTHEHLNNIPFADHGALLDPPTADLTARCLCMLAQQGYPREHPTIRRALEFLKREQERDGSWFGRWGTNYIYGTWSVLCALNAVGEDLQAPYVRKAVAWLEARQQADGGWGESCASYWEERKDERVPSLPSQTAWALLGLMAAGEVESAAVARGIAYLEQAPREDGALARGALQRGRLPARLLSPLPRLQRLLPALGARPLPQPDAPERPPGRLGHVTACAARRNVLRPHAEAAGPTPCSSVALARGG